MSHLVNQLTHDEPSFIWMKNHTGNLYLITIVYY